MNPDGSATLTSSATVAPGYGGVDLTPPAGTTFASLSSLSLDFKVDTGDCGGGSPRIQLDTPTPNQTVFVYLGPTPSFTGCSSTYTNTGNIVNSSDLRVDTSQIPGGTFYDTWAHAVSLLGSTPITGVQVVVDSYWFAGDQVVTVRNIDVDGVYVAAVGPPTTKDDCKDGGWEKYNVPRQFKNQGDCIQYVNTGK